MARVRACVRVCVWWAATPAAGAADREQRHSDAGRDERAGTDVVAKLGAEKHRL
jgi:hypothetical protein